MKFYKRDPEAFKGGTLGLSLEEIGAYTLLLDDIYARDGNVPDNIDYLHRLWRCDIRVAKRLRQKLLDTEKIIENGKLLTNLRATCELLEPNLKPYLEAKAQRKQQNGPTELRTKNQEGGASLRSRSSSKFKTINGGKSDGRIHSAVEACDRLIERLGGKPGEVDYDPTEDGSFGLPKR